ncbi:hypothetical protein CPB85DRAFT_886047 [Mucidula mucida]|nr:hypothetical protein CPB85DRAFT_886047 [Mucidula mucida]
MMPVGLTRRYPNIAKDDAMYALWVLLSQELYKVKDSLQSGSEASDSAPTCTSDALVDKCIQTATRLWEVTVAAPYYYRPSNNNGNTQQVDRIIRLGDLYISTERVSSCQPLFVDLLQKKPMKRDTFDTIYKSLTVRLRGTVEKKISRSVTLPSRISCRSLLGFTFTIYWEPSPNRSICGQSGVVAATAIQ